MTTMRLTGLFIIFILMTVALVSAVPTTSPVTSADIRQATFEATGGSVGTQGWFVWGFNRNLYWSTPNQTIAAGGGFMDTQIGAPMLTSTAYNVTACDETGCDPTPEIFVIPAATLVPRTNFGSQFIGMMKSGMNVTQVSSIIIVPFTMVMTESGSTDIIGAAGLLWGIFFMFIFAGYWLRGKGILLPSYIAIISGVMLFAGAGVQNSVYPTISPIQLSPVFVSIGLPLMIIGFAGVFVSWFFNK